MIRRTTCALDKAAQEASSQEDGGCMALKYASRIHQAFEGVRVGDPRTPDVPELGSECGLFFIHGSPDYATVRERMFINLYGNGAITLLPDGRATYSIKLYTDGKPELTFELQVTLDDNGYVGLDVLKIGK